MKHFIGLTILTLVSCFSLKAQSKLPPIYEIKADTSAYMEVPDKNWQILEDPTNKLTIDQVSSPAFDSKFHTNTTRTKGYDYKITNYWVRYTFKNTLNHSVKVAINETGTRADLYTAGANGKWNVETTGSLVPYAQRSGLKRYLFFLKTIEPGQQIIFYEKDTFDFWLSKPKEFVMYIGFAEPLIKLYYIEDDALFKGVAISSVACGILMLAALINLLFYRIVKEKTYLFFSLFLISFACWTFCSTDWMLFQHHAYLYMSLRSAGLLSFFFFFMHFIRNYLSTDVYTPKWDKFLIILSWLLALSWSVQLFMPTTLNFQTTKVIGICVSVFMYSYIPTILGTTLYYLRKNKSAKLGIIALMPNLIWQGVGYGYMYVEYRLYLEYKRHPSALYLWMNKWNDVAELVCMLWLVIVFSWILFKRFQDMQQSLVQSSLDREIERNQLIASQNEELEKQVAARTAELTTANRELSDKQEEITAQRDQLSETVNELKTTQQQLIQSEKLASLGELTAGIAHEIQNPLNFVNNFAEVSIELVDEMGEELTNGDKEEAIAIAADIKQNLEKIHHHGRRADSIVKGMLQHSRANSHVKEPTDINKLADEYLRLAYHGLRAKDKSFNADMVTTFADGLPEVNIVPQDIGRVLLNLYTNAFYAIQKKKESAVADYKPTVWLSTVLFTPPSRGRGVNITVRDNGIGIPDSIKDKILQPFFTTKPTGEGTGLGLSISYDIVAKGHGGKINIDSQAGDYTIFTIWLPL